MMDEVMDEPLHKRLDLPRDVFKTPIHPAALLFPKLPDDELRDLADDIKKNGLLQPIIVLDGNILDGRNRLKACKLAGVEPRFQPFTNEIDPLDFVLSCNLLRRHLTPAQRREVIAAVLKQKPQQSNNEIAKQTKTSDKTVAAVRGELESTSEIPKLDKTTGKDGKQRKTHRGGYRSPDRVALRKQWAEERKARKVRIQALEKANAIANGHAKDEVPAVLSSNVPENGGPAANGAEVKEPERQLDKKNEDRLWAFIYRCAEAAENICDDLEKRNEDAWKLFGRAEQNIEELKRFRAAYEKLERLASMAEYSARGKEAEQKNGEIKVRGKGIDLGYEAINCLKRIPKNDALRMRGFEVVKDWINLNQ
jgi:ParB-like chromosome segregation protein Spo0J